MKDDRQGIAEMERLIAGLAPPARREAGRRAHRERLRESARRAARAEIRRVFRRRLLRRLAGGVAAFALLCGALDHMSLVLIDIMYPPSAGPGSQSGIMFTIATPPPPQYTTLGEEEPPPPAGEEEPEPTEQP